jgi:hypothetical protein
MLVVFLILFFNCIIKISFHLLKIESNHKSFSNCCVGLKTFHIKSLSKNEAKTQTIEIKLLSEDNEVFLKELSNSTFCFSFHIFI